MISYFLNRLVSSIIFVMHLIFMSLNAKKKKKISIVNRYDSDGIY